MAKIFRKQLSVYVTTDVHRAVELTAARRGVSMAELLMELLERGGLPQIVAAENALREDTDD